MSTELARVPGRAVFDQIALRLAELVGADIAFVGTLRSNPTPTIRTLGFSIDGSAVAQTEFNVEGTPCAQVLREHAATFPRDVLAAFPDAHDLRALGAESYLAAALEDASGRVIGVIAAISRRPLPDHERLAPVVALFALRAAAEVERQRVEERLSTVFDCSPEALIISDDTGRIIQHNRAAEETFGYSHQELNQLSIEDLVPPEDQERHTLQREAFQADGSARRMGVTRGRLWAVRKDGHRIPVEISLSPVQSPEETLVVSTIRDVSYRVRMEEERARIEARLRQVQKMESLGTLAGGIAHDFNNLLTVIAGGLELAKIRVGSSHDANEPLNSATTAAARAKELVRQILSFSRRQPTTRSSTPLAEIVDEVAQLLRASLPSGILITTAASPDTPNVFVDPSQIHQVLMNLGTNAWQAIVRPSGRISFALDHVTVQSGSPEALSGVAPGTWVRLSVEDNGIGMNRDTLERMFEPFFTTKSSGKGTGLGLAVVHGIVIDHGGTMTVTSEPQRGTTVSVYLPPTFSAGAPSKGPTVSTPPRAATARVLLVDDELLVVEVAQELLEHLGYDVISCRRGRDAVDAVRRDPMRFDVVITDHNMPEMTGLDVARAVAAIRPDLPVVMISGNPLHSDVELAAPNIRCHVPKPFTGAALSHAIDLALVRDRPEGPSVAIGSRD